MDTRRATYRIVACVDARHPDTHGNRTQLHSRLPSASPGLTLIGETPVAAAPFPRQRRRRARGRSGWCQDASLMSPLHGARDRVVALHNSERFAEAQLPAAGNAADTKGLSQRPWPFRVRSSWRSRGAGAGAQKGARRRRCLHPSARRRVVGRGQAVAAQRGGDQKDSGDDPSLLRRLHVRRRALRSLGRAVGGGDLPLPRLPICLGRRTGDRGGDAEGRGEGDQGSVKGFTKTADNGKPITRGFCSGSAARRCRVCRAEELIAHRQSGHVSTTAAG